MHGRDVIDAEVARGVLGNVLFISGPEVNLRVAAHRDAVRETSKVLRPEAEHVLVKIEGALHVK